MRQFNQQKPLETLVTDLTYVRVANHLAYVCLILDLFNREIIGLSLGWHKTADLVKEAIQSIPYALTKVKLFHSDRGKEYENALLVEMLEAFGITRSLSQAGCPYDNAVTESTNCSFNLEFINQETFRSLEKLTLITKDYVHWWNHHRNHGSLHYQTPMAKRAIVSQKHFINFVQKSVTFSNFKTNIYIDLNSKKGRNSPFQLIS